MDLIQLITIDHEKVSGSSALSNFIFLFKSTIEGLRTTSNGGVVTSTNGYDILFFADAELTTQLDHEIVHYDASTGEFIAWVLIPSVSHNTDTEIYLGAGDDSITTSQENVAAVWSDYGGVWHLSEVSGNRLDSTSNGLTLTDVNGVGQADGKWHKSASFNGTDQKLQRAHSSAISGANANIQFSVWVYANDVSAERDIFSKWADGPGNAEYRAVYRLPEAKFAFNFRNSSDATVATFANTPSPISADVWYRIDSWYEHSAQKQYIMINGGTLYEVTNTNGTQASTQDLVVGAFLPSDSYSHWSGRIQELRIRKSLLSVEHLRTEYENQNDPGSFYTVGQVPNPTDSIQKDLNYNIVVPYDSPMVFGEDTDTSEDPVSWAGWRKADGSPATVTGDPDFGSIVIAPGEFAVSPVFAYSTQVTKTINLEADKYDTGSGTGQIQYRVSTSPFAWDSESPTWETYSTEVEETFQYIQFRLDNPEE